MRDQQVCNNPHCEGYGELLGHDNQFIVSPGPCPDCGEPLVPLDQWKYVPSRRKQKS